MKGWTDGWANAELNISGTHGYYERTKWDGHGTDRWMYGRTDKVGWDREVTDVHKDGKMFKQM